MTTPARCSSCGRRLPQDSRVDVCPVCEFTGALEASLWDSTGQPAHPAAPVRMGDYELGEEIARGGMGVVYKARQVSLNRTVALKMILAGEFAGARFVQRFRTEAEAAAKLHHPNIVAIHEIGEYQGRHFFSMDYVDGPSLQEAVRQEPFSPKRAATCVQILAEAVDYAHQQGVLHRDLKPSNVLLGPGDQPMITDFGLAKVLTSDTELTMSGQILGTPGYLPPEQASGHRGAVGPGSDVYGLGALLYYLLTSRPPFQAQDVTDILDQVLNREPVSPRLLNPSVPRDLETICLKCLEKDAARRYPSARELAEDLGRYLRSETISARTTRPPEKAWRWCRRKPALAGALAACAGALLVGFIGISWQWRRAAGEAQAARRSLYDSDLLLAQQAFDEDNFGRVEQLLKKHDPRISGRRDEDLRGWEWHFLAGKIRSEELFTLGSHADTVNYLVFSPDGRTLASVSHYLFANEVKVWDVPSRRLVITIPGKRLARGMTVAFSLDNRRMALADDKQARFFEAPDWRELGQSRTYTNTIAAVTYSPDGTALVVAETTGVFPEAAVTHFLDPHTLKGIDVLPVGAVRGLTFSPDSKTVAVMLRARDKVTLWDRSKRAVVAEFPGPGPFYRHGNVIFSPDGQMLAVVIGKLNYEERRIDLWKVPQGTLIRSIADKQADFSGAAFSLDSRLLYLSSTDQKIRVYEVATGQCLDRFQGHRDEVWCIARSPDGTMLATGGRDGKIRFWPTQVEAVAPDTVPLPEATRQAYLAQDGSALAVITTNQTVQIWSSRSGECLFSHPLPATNILEWSNNENVQVVLASRGTHLALGAGTHFPGGDQPRFLKIWDMASMRAVGEFQGLSTHTCGLALSPDEKLLAASGFFGGEKALVWEVASGKRIRELAPVPTKAGLVRFSPRQSYVAIRLDENFTWGLSVGIWRLADARRVLVFSKPRHRIIDLAFSPDERFLATAGEDATMCVWDVQTGQKACELTGQLTSYTAVTWSRDGTRLIGGGQDGTLTIWDAVTRQQVSRLKAHSSRVLGVAFTEDGHTLVSLSLESLRLWHASSSAEIRVED